MNDIDAPNLGQEPMKPILSAENLEFHSGNSTFSKEDFIRAVKPYFADLKRVNRTRFLCVFTYGNGDKTDVTGYKSDTTINVTNNSKVLKSRSTGGNWAVYQLKS